MVLTGKFRLLHKGAFVLPRLVYIIYFFLVQFRNKRLNTPAALKCVQFVGSAELARTTPPPRVTAIGVNSFITRNYVLDQS